MPACPDDNQLDGYVVGSLRADEASTIEEHVAGCEECRETLSALARAGQSAALADAATLRSPSFGHQGGADDLLLPGDELGRYRIEALLGSGTMGVVYRAADPRLDRHVALKVLRTEGLADGAREEFAARLMREARAMARLSHPNVVTVHDVDEDEGRLYLAMELIEGKTLATWLGAESKPWPEVLEIFVAAGRGLAAAHARGILHRDFKPDNVLLDGERRVRVTDFGLARGIQEGVRQAPASGSATADELTRTGAILGTPLYMAPEQIAGDETGTAADQFSYCVALWRGLYGELPFAADTLDELRARIVSGGPPSPPARSKVPAAIRAALLVGLSARPQDRHPSMNALLERLGSAARARRRAAGVGALAALATLGIAAALLASSDEPSRCQSHRARFAEVWSQGREVALRTVFAAVNPGRGAASADRTAAALDEYGERWASMHQETCRATHVLGEQSDKVLDLRMRCLEDRRQSVDALLEVLLDEDLTDVDRSVEAALALPAVDACGEIERLEELAAMPGDEATREAIARWRQELAAIEALRDLGGGGAALERAIRASEGARDTGYRPLEGRAYLLRGSIEKAAGKIGEATTSYRAAVLAAEAGRDDEILARAWIALARQVGYEQGDHERGAELVAHAAAALEGLGGDAVLEAALERVRGSMAAEQGLTAQAIGHFERALDLYEDRLGREHPIVADALDNLGTASMSTGDLDRALALHRRAGRIRETALGAGHPAIARSMAHIGNVLFALGRLEEAEGELEAAYELRRDVLGEEHVDTALAATDYARALSRKGAYDRAREMYQRAIDITRRAYGGDHVLVGRQQALLANLERRRGRTDESIRLYREAEAILSARLGAAAPEVSSLRVTMGQTYVAGGRPEAALPIYRQARGELEASVPPHDPAVATVLILEGEALLALGRPGDAIEPLETLNRFPTGGVPPRDLGVFRFALARALWESRADRARARALAAEARDHLAAAGASWKSDRAEIEAWIAEHQGRPEEK